MDIKYLIKNSIGVYGQETKRLEFLPENRYNTNIFPGTGQYDWFSGQLLYCLIRYIRPEKILEISTASGYATLFMASALKKNKKGIIDTFELNANIAKAAQDNFRRYKVSRFIRLITGDARTTSINCDKDYDIYFLDSLHSEDFARWFVKSHILPSVKNNSLFHMHDIMPRHAKVRCWQALPIKQKVKNIIKKILRRTYNNAETDELISIKENSLYDGNRTTEAILGNKLAKLMNKSEYVFLYDIADEYPELEPRKYNSKAMARQDAKGNPLEWNESLWCYSKPLKRAYKKLNPIRKC